MSRSVMLLLLVLVVSVTWNGQASDNNRLLISAFQNIPILTHHKTNRPLLHTRTLRPLLLALDDASSAESPSLESSSSENLAAPRSIRVERMPRLPVWPVWAGVIDFLVGWILGPEAGSKLEQYFLGGRVCPMQLDGKSTSPFLLLVHHHHNFWKWDAIFRKLSSLVLPEGFPAHPHRGFTTLTYFLEDDEPKTGGGGFVHRDSIGVKQTYGARGSYQHQAQWLFTGSGMLHEEMFDFVQTDFGNQSPSYSPRYELYQLWINVPGTHKLDPPQVQLLAEGNDADEDSMNAMPRVVLDKTVMFDDKRLNTHSEVVVIAGSYTPFEEGSQNESFQSQAGPLHSDLSVLHVTVEETEKRPPTTRTTTNVEGPGWIYDIPADHDTLIVYVRKGSCTMETIAVSPTDGSVVSESSTTQIPIHSTVFVEKDAAALKTGTRERLIVRPQELDDPLDLLVLSGRPLYREDANEIVEPVAMQGSMVMNNNAQIQQAYTDYQYGKMGVPWDHELGDEQWMEHVEQTKPRRMASELLASMQEYEK